MVVLEAADSSQEFKAPPANEKAKMANGMVKEEETSSAKSRNGETIANDIFPRLAYFDRREIRIDGSGPVGEGYNGIVYSIAGFRERDEIHESLSLPNQQARERLCSQPSRYVIKHLHPRLLLHQRQIENAALDLVAEANFLRQLDHPHVLRLEGVAHGGAAAAYRGGFDGFFLITQRLRETLAQRIETWKTYRNADAPLLVHKYQTALQIASALEYLHQQRLVFRDLKPSNLGFAAEDPDRIQLFDFGLCRKLPASRGEDDASSSFCQDTYEMSGGVGTRRYCAVEVCRHLPYNRKADVYSWSMVAWEMLTLQKPFGDFSKQDHQRLVCEMGGTPNLSRHDLSDRMQSLLRNSWSRNVAKRWTSSRVCQELEEMVSELQAQQGNSSRSVGEHVSPLGQLRRNKAMDRKDALVDLQEECCSGPKMGYLSAQA